MQTTTSPDCLESATACDDTPPAPLNITILFDDQAAGQGAQHALTEGFAAEGSGVELRAFRWRFDELREASARERAATWALNSDVFVVATSGRRPVPAHVIEWIEEAFEHRNRVAPVVTVVYDRDNDPHYFGALCESLVRHEAEAAGLSLLSAGQLAAFYLR